jgi:uncharacterized protein
MRRLLVFLLFVSIRSLGQIPAPMPDTYVNDHIGRLDASQVQRLNEMLLVLEQATTVQVAVLLLPSLPEGMAIESYAREVGNSWKVGRYKNGIVYVASLADRKHRLEVADALLPQLPNERSQQIIDNLRPFLQQGDYFGAVSHLVSQLSDQLTSRSAPLGLKNDALAVSESIEPYEPLPLTEFEKEKAKYEGYWKIIGWVLVGGAVLFCIWAWRYKKKYVAMFTVNGEYRGVGSAYWNSVYGSSDDSSRGGSSGFGGGGGSGGGGGGFSGGGASGSW